MLAVFVQLYSLLATVQGRECFASDIIAHGDSYTTATIPQHCTHLSLRNNSISFGDVGAAALAEALKVNAALTTLSLNGNNIGDVGAAALAEALKGNAALKELRLENTTVGDVGAAALVEALKINTALKTLYLHSNSIRCTEHGRVQRASRSTDNSICRCSGTHVVCSRSSSVRVSSARVSSCNAALDSTNGCARRSWASAAACSECAGQKAAALSSAGCSTVEIKAWCAALPLLPKSLPQLSPAAAAAVARAASAGKFSPLARPALTELFGSNTTRALLQQLDTGDKLYELSGARLLARVEAELASAELIHNFGNPIPPVTCTESLNCGFDLELQNMPAVPDFYNQWTLQSLGLVPTDPLNNAFTERAETNIFGYAPFANTSAPDVNTSAGRPFYSALNLYRDSAGNLQCGPIAAVLSSQFVGTNAIAFPVDTGNFGLPECLTPPPHSPVNWSSCFMCEDCAPHPPLGQPGNLLHLLLPFFSYRHHTLPVDKKPSVEETAARLMVRLLSRSTFRHAVDPTLSPKPPLPLSWVENTVRLHTRWLPRCIACVSLAYRFLLGVHSFRVFFACCAREGDTAARTAQRLTPLMHMPMLRHLGC